MRRLRAGKGVASSAVRAFTGRTPSHPPVSPPALPPPTAVTRETGRNSQPTGFMAAAKKAVLGPLVGAVDQGTSSTRFLVSLG